MDGGIEDGANCQRFAYAVLRHFGRVVPDVRSRELWEDTVHTFIAPEWKPLDLILFNNTRDSFGAHVGVCWNEGSVLHLCKAIGRPAVWELARFCEYPRYRVVIGAKRTRK